MGRVYVERDGQWIEDESLRSCGPYVFEVSGIFELSKAISLTPVPVPHGLGMGWPGLKDLGVALDFADEAETIKLNKGTNL